MRHMRVRRSLSSLLVALLLLQALRLACEICTVPAHHRVTRARFERIHDGMTLREVNGLLGAENAHWWGFADGSAGFSARCSYREDDTSWPAPSDTIEVRFRSADGRELRVFDKAFHEPTQEEVERKFHERASFPDRLKERVRRWADWKSRLKLILK
jgi:hypothetical protein